MAALTAADVKRLLHLEPHPREGGSFTRTFTSGEPLAPGNFTPTRYDGQRHTSTAIYYLLEPGTFSEMHVLASDELFHHYLGDPVEMLQLHPDGTAGTHILGSDLLTGQRPQVAVRRGVWQGSHLLPWASATSIAPAPQHGYALLGCTVAPGFEYADYRSASRSDLIGRWPGQAGLIVSLTRN